MKFRNELAEEGHELTPEQAKKLHMYFENFKDSVKEAVKVEPNFYRIVCNRTTEEKLVDMKRYEKSHNDKMTLKEYNKIQEAVKLICEVYGYDKTQK
jgi:hypothetical protein